MKRQVPDDETINKAIKRAADHRHVTMAYGMAFAAGYRGESSDGTSPAPDDLLTWASETGQDAATMAHVETILDEYFDELNARGEVYA